MHKFIANSQQTDEMETFSRYDAGSFQGGANFKAHIKSSSCIDAAVCTEIIENANQILGTTVAQDEYENY